jgi:hypothetical protein
LYASFIAAIKPTTGSFEGPVTEVKYDLASLLIVEKEHVGAVAVANDGPVGSTGAFAVSCIQLARTSMPTTATLVMMRELMRGLSELR